MEMKKVKLTPKQSAFIDAYCSNGGNATKAAITAGYSEKTAQEIGAENLSKPIIKDAIELRQQPIAKKMEITRESLILEIEYAQKMAEELGKPEVYIKGTDLKAKMLGLNEPKKIELSGGIEQKVKVNINFK